MEEHHRKARCLKPIFPTAMLNDMADLAYGPSSTRPFGLNCCRPKTARPFKVYGHPDRSLRPSEVKLASGRNPPLMIQL
jgi:hypothetical protein